jgi:hypothetical protein
MVAAGFGTNVVNGSYVSSITQAAGVIITTLRSTKANSADRRPGHASHCGRREHQRRHRLRAVEVRSRPASGCGHCLYAGGMLPKWLPSSCK